MMMTSSVNTPASAAASPVSMKRAMLSGPTIIVASGSTSPLLRLGLHELQRILIGLAAYRRIENGLAVVVGQAVNEFPFPRQLEPGAGYLTDHLPLLNPVQHRDLFRSRARIGLVIEDEIHAARLKGVEHPAIERG